MAIGPMKPLSGSNKMPHTPKFKRRPSDHPVDHDGDGLVNELGTRKQQAAAKKLAKQGAKQNGLGGGLGQNPDGGNLGGWQPPKQTKEPPLNPPPPPPNAMNIPGIGGGGDRQANIRDMFAQGPGHRPNVQPFPQGQDEINQLFPNRQQARALRQNRRQQRAQERQQKQQQRAAQTITDVPVVFPLNQLSPQQVKEIIKQRQQQAKDKLRAQTAAQAQATAKAEKDKKDKEKADKAAKNAPQKTRPVGPPTPPRDGVVGSRPTMDRVRSNRGQISPRWQAELNAGRTTDDTGQPLIRPTADRLPTREESMAKRRGKDVGNAISDRLSKANSRGKALKR